MKYQKTSIKNIKLRITKQLTVDQLKDLAACANQFNSYIIIQTANYKINAKSYMSVFSLLTKSAGQEVEVIAEGEDAAQAINQLSTISSIFEKVH